ncbi:MAG TPA: Gfo/Idh/MocA family oxidoreductase [Chthoniobacterales bacterium]
MDEPSVPRKAILAGCGLMSREWLRCAQELGIEVAALVDPFPSAAETRAKEARLTVPIYPELGQAVAEVPAQILFDCTIPAAHREVSGLGLRSGLHVLEEKPLALDLEGAEELVRLAESNGRLHVVQQNRRFNRGMRTMRQMIADGTIGEVTTVHADFFVGAHFGGFREKMRHVLLTDMAIHPFDAVRYLIQANGDSVFCEEWTPANSWYEHGSSVVAIFQMAGVRFCYRASWCSEGFRTPWDANWRVIGTHGTLLWDGEGDVRGERVRPVPGALLYDAESLPMNVEPDPAFTRGHFSVMKQFVNALDGGPLPETRSSDNIHSLAMVLAAVESAETGQRVVVRTSAA